MKPKFKTDGEILFSRLLTERGLTYKYELSHSDKKKTIDFTVTLKGKDILSEVRDLDLNEEDKDIITNLSNSHSASWEQNKPYKRIRRAVEEKADQLKEYDSNSTFVVLYKNPFNLTVDLSTENILESLYADRSLVFYFDDSGDMASKTVFNAKDAVFRKDKNIHISAVGVVENFKPNMELANKITKEYKKSGGNALTEKGQKELTALFDEQRNQGVDFELEVVRLRIVHNVFAKMPLNLGFMVSIYDEEIFHDLASSKLKKKTGNLITDFP